MSNKPKILVVSNTPLDNAGVQAVIMNIARSLGSEYTFDILLLTDKESYYDGEFAVLGGKIFRTATPKGAFWSKADYYLRASRVYRKVRKTIKENGPYSAVHCHCHLEAGICLSAAKKSGVPIRVAHTHIIEQKVHFVRRIYNAYYRLLIEKYATHKLGCSNQACESFYSVQGETMVMNNPYDEEKFCFGKYPEVEFDSPKLLQIGSFSRRKNQLFSIDVIAEIKKKYPNVKFDMIGFEVDNILDKMKNKIKELELEDNITIHPCDADSAVLLSQSSYSLIPSTSEAFGIVAIESQAMGVKCYASNALPLSTDCGGCEYLPLSAGAKVWADRIIEEFKKTGGKHEKYDCSAFSSKAVAEEYRRIYSGQDK